MDHEPNFFDACKACAQSIGKAINWIRDIIIEQIRLTWRKWWIVLPITILGIAAGVYYSRPANKIYKVEAIAILNGPTAEAARIRFEALNNIAPVWISEEQSLGKMLGLPAEAWRINHFRTFYMQDCLADGTVDYIDLKQKAPLTDTLNVRVPDMLMLQFRTKDPKFIPLFEEKIMAYMNADPQFEQAYQLTRTNMEREHQFDMDQAEKLDSLTSSFYFAEGASMGAPQIVEKKYSGLVLGERRIRLFLDEIQDFYQQKHYRETRLAYCTAPVVLQNHFVMSMRAVNRRSICMLIGCIIGWILATLIAAIITYRHEIKDWLSY
ncbi:MAG: hypothetical protein MJZ82_04905 [Paludibacteraceae bacterium]|nr:hypothetical protein [Paludibacteraceae bacterium]